jgi:hypothetical protein
MLHDDAKAAGFGRRVLRAYTEPAFAVVSKGELDLAVFEALLEAEALPLRADGSVHVFDAAALLRVTPARIRSLALRAGLRASAATLAARLRQQLVTARLRRAGDRVEIAVPDDALREFLRSRLQALNETPDFRTNRELLLIAPEAFAGLLEQLLPADQAKAAQAGLRRAGFAGNSLGEVLRGAILRLAAHVAGAAGEQAAGAAVELGIGFLRPLFERSQEEIANAWTTLRV